MIACIAAVVYALAAGVRTTIKPDFTKTNAIYAIRKTNALRHLNVISSKINILYRSILRLSAVGTKSGRKKQ
jgi:hypothetical protein